MPRTSTQPLRQLSPFVDKVRVGALRPNNIFLLCLKASLARAYDYAVFVEGLKVNTGAFFLVPTLRSICEDVIVFGLLRTLPHADRGAIISGVMQHEVLTKLDAQAAFFRAERPHQSVLVPPSNAATVIDRVEQEVRSTWQRHGWKFSRGLLPQTRQIAAKQGEHVLAVLYEFLFRFTSGTVHFNPQVLLRTGWGDRHRITFKAAHFNQYYLEVARTYSVYLLCLYFERFRKFFRLPQHEASVVENLRAELRLLERWPEIVTHEEMNLPPPKFRVLAILARAIDARTNRPLLDNSRRRSSVARPESVQSADLKPIEGNDRAELPGASRSR